MAAKIKDGLFIGDAETSQDPEFLELNKISNLVNLSGREVANVWASHGLVYLNYNWEDRPDFKLFDDHDDAVGDLVEFVDTSLKHGVSVLLFSRRGVGRCAVAMCAYLMFKYHWGFAKSFDLVFSKKPDIDINKGFEMQLMELDKRLHSRRQQQLRQLQMHGSDVGTVEMQRWCEWDSKYIIHDIQEERTRVDTSSRKLRDDVIEETPSDELVMINSFLNGKQTITNLPLPNRSAIDTPKAFKLRFNSELQEEDIHMFPTAPPTGQAAIPKRGILKATNRQHSQNGQRPSVRHNVEQQDNNFGSRQHAHHSDVDERIRTDDRDSVASRDRYQYQQQQMQQQQQRLQTQQAPPQQQRTRPSSSDGGDRDRERDRIPSNAASKRTGAGDRGSNSEDLYQFIGLGASARAPSSHSHSQQMQPQAQPQQQQQQGRQVSVEDRLWRLVADMQVSNGHNAGAGADTMGNPSGRQSAKDIDPMSMSSQPTLYELANMHVSSGQPGQPAPYQRRQDPLAAFESMQQGGAIKVRHDLVPGQRTFATVNGGAPPPAVRGAWFDESGPKRASSPSASVASTQLTGQAPKTYRHGSPAPNRMARSSQSAGQTTQNMTSNPAGVVNRGAVWTGTSSVTSAGSGASSSGRDRVPSSRDMPTRTTPAAYSQPRRDPSPTQARKSADRPPSPTPMLRKAVGGQMMNPSGSVGAGNVMGGPNASPGRGGYSSASASGPVSTNSRRGSHASDGDNGSFSSMGSMGGGSVQERRPSPMLVGSRATPQQTNSNRPATPTRSWRF